VTPHAAKQTGVLFYCGCRASNCVHLCVSCGRSANSALDAEASCCCSFADGSYSAVSCCCSNQKVSG
jgi:hypothetical protein